jgi:hypothetical protein
MARKRSSVRTYNRDLFIIVKYAKHDAIRAAKVDCTPLVEFGFAIHANQGEWNFHPDTQFPGSVEPSVHYLSVKLSFRQVAIPISRSASAAVLLHVALEHHEVEFSTVCCKCLICRVTGDVK